MPEIKPFKAVRPVRNKVHLVTTRSYISYTKKQLQQKLDSNPYSFIHVINPDGVDTNKLKGKQRFKKVRSRFDQFIKNQIFTQDSKPCFYIYRQTGQEHTYTGIVALSSLEDYKKKQIKKHEDTITNRQEVFTEYLSVTKINAEPVLLTYRHKKDISDFISTCTSRTPEYEFYTTDQVLHEVWIVSIKENIRFLESAFARIPAFYIADGHHRTASSYQLYQSNKNEAYRYFLSYLVSDQQLAIKGFNRFIKLPITEQKFKTELRKYFNLSDLKSVKKQGIKMFFKGQWFFLKPKVSSRKMDVEVFTDLVLKKILQVEDLKAIPFIKYAPNNKDVSNIEQDMLAHKFDVAFMIDPAEISDIFKYSDQGKTLPPKTTWIEPKLRSALLIYQYE